LAVILIVVVVLIIILILVIILIRILSIIHILSTHLVSPPFLIGLATFYLAYTVDAIVTLSDQVRKLTEQMALVTTK
jgi:hypothetical protein